MDRHSTKRYKKKKLTSNEPVAFLLVIGHLVNSAMRQWPVSFGSKLRGRERLWNVLWNVHSWFSSSTLTSIESLWYFRRGRYRSTRPETDTYNTSNNNNNNNNNMGVSSLVAVTVLRELSTRRRKNEENNKITHGSKDKRERAKLSSTAVYTVQHSSK